MSYYFFSKKEDADKYLKIGIEPKIQGTIDEKRSESIFLTDDIDWYIENICRIEKQEFVQKYEFLKIICDDGLNIEQRIIRGVWLDGDRIATHEFICKTKILPEFIKRMCD